MAAANKHKILSPSNLDIIGLATTTPDTATDFLAIYDASLGGNRKVLIDNLGFSSNAFTIFQPDSGTAPTADSGSDTLTMTSGDSSISVAGNSTSDTIDLEVDINALTAEATVDSANDYLMMYDASAGVVRKVLVSAVGGGGSTEDVVFNSSAAGTIPLTLEGSASQTADFFLVEDSAAAIQFQVDASGVVRSKLRTNSSDSVSFGPVGGGHHGINFHGGTGNNAITTIHAANAAVMRLNNQGLLVTSTSYAVRASTNGTAAVPAYSFDNDRDCGLYRVAANNLAMSIASTNILDFQSTKITTPLPFLVGQFATGSLPTASSFEGGMVYDTTTQTMKWSDGTSWATI